MFVGRGGEGWREKGCPPRLAIFPFRFPLRPFTTETPDNQVTRFYFFLSRYLPSRKFSYRHAISSRSQASNTKSDLQSERKQEIKRALGHDLACSPGNTITDAKHSLPYLLASFSVQLATV